VYDVLTREYIDAEGRHKQLPMIGRSLNSTRHNKFPAETQDLVNVSHHMEWDEAQEKWIVLQGWDALDKAYTPEDKQRAREYAIKYLGIDPPAQAVAEDSEHYNGIELSIEIEKDDEYVDDDDYDNQTLYVRATSGGKELGHVLFSFDGEYLLPQDLEVEERYRGRGIAQTMYDFVKSKGYKIRRSGQQTDAGAGFWAKHRPEQNVWENFAKEFTNYQGLRPPKNVPGTNLFPGQDIVGQRVYHCTNSLEAIKKSGGLKPRRDATGEREYGRLSTDEHPFIPVIGIWFSVGKPNWVGKHCVSFVIEPTDQVYVAYANTKGLKPNVVLNPIALDRLTVEGQQDVAENFADGRNPQDKGDSKRHHVPTKSSVSNLRKFAKNHSGRAAQLAHWAANMKAGRAKKKTNETIIGNLHFPQLTVAIDDHAVDRTRTRGINPHAIDQSLKKLNNIADQLAQVAPNSQVWAYDPETQLGLGMRRISSQNMLFKLKTVVNSRPFDGPIPIIDLS